MPIEDKDICEQCDREVPVDDLREYPDTSDGNRYLTCHSCRQRMNQIFQEELERSYEEETEAAFKYGVKSTVSKRHYSGGF